uniref:Uncharacterized protein n=2 Tax=Clytia hemisphaerica TaxID=252671 RepID=A0A7M5UUI9_9CNID
MFFTVFGRIKILTKMKDEQGSKDNSITQNNEEAKSNDVNTGYISDDPVILEAFNDIKAAILAKRTDIVRQILSAAQSLRDEDEYDSEGEEQDKKELGHKYDKGEYVDLLSLLLLHKDTDSGTLLHYATRIDSIDIVRAILAAGANCTVKNTEDLNPYQYCKSDQMKNVYVGELMQAVSQSRIYRIEQLVSAGIDINSCDGSTSSNSILHWAVSFSDLQTIKLVLDKGGSVNAVNGNGESPLHDAVKRADPDIVQELLQRGADCNVVPIKGSCAGKSPLMLAQSKPILMEVLNNHTTHSMQNGQDPSSPTSTLTNGNVSTADITTPGNPVQIQPTIASKPPTPSLVTTVELDSMFQFLCPTPKFMKQYKGLFFVPPTQLIVQLIGKEGDLVGLKNIIDAFSTKIQDIGTTLTYECHSCACISPPASIHMQCIINKRNFSQPHEYKLQFTTTKVLLISSSLEAMYNGMATFLQTLKLFKGKAVPLVQICDWPNQQTRSVVFDFHHNDAPNLNLLCEIADLLSLFKVNQIQINTDHVIRKEDKAFYTPNEFLEFQVFCQQRFIEVTPYISIPLQNPYNTFFKTNIQNQQLDLQHDELSRQISSFVLSKTLHISSTEPHHITPCQQQLQNFCSTRNILLQLPAEALPDIHLDQSLQYIDNNLYTVTCSNKSELEVRSYHARNLGLNFAVCIKDHTLERICPESVQYLSRVHEIASSLPSHGCHGFATIFGNQNKHLANLSLCLPSLMITSSMGWNVCESITADYVRSITNYLIYEDDHDVIGSRILRLGFSLPLETNATNIEDGGEVSTLSVIDDLIQRCSSECQNITIEHIQEFCKQIKSLKNELEKMKLHIRSRQFVLDEFALLTEMLFFVARLCYGVINDKEKSVLLELKNLSQVHKSDYSNKLMVFIKQYESFLQKYYKNASSTYTTLQLLENILLNILPNTAAQSAPGLMGVFTV